MSDEELRTAYARAVARREPDRSGCPTPDELLAATRREGPERRRLEILDHALTCAACRQEFELLRAIEVSRRGTAGESARRIRSYRPLAVALAASLLVAIGLGGRSLWREAAVDVTRGTADHIAPLLPADGATVAAGAPLAFAWRPLPGAGRYTLELFTPEGVVRASVVTPDTTAVLEAVALAPGEYRWMVRAAAPAGQRRSPTRTLLVLGAPGA